MKNIIFMITLCFLLGASIAQGQEIQCVGKAYSFPVIPGTEAWKQLNSHEEMLRATEVPDRVLQQMSTDDLLATAMNYPLKWDALAFDNMIVGVKTVAARSTIFKELFRRQDVSEKVLALYQTLDPNTPGPDWPLERAGKYSLALSFVEALLAQPQIASTLTSDQSNVLLKLISANHVKMQLRTDLYGGMSQGISAFLAGKILNQKGFSTDLLAKADVSVFLNGQFRHPSEEVVSSIFSATEQFLLTIKN